MDNLPSQTAETTYNPPDVVEEPSTDPAVVAPSIEPAASQSNWKGALREIAETIILTLVIFLLIRTVVQNFRVEGMSMEPNFHDGQFLLINKLAYKLGDLERGDVIVFRYPRDPSRDFIKRVIGLPGETVEIINGQVYINGELLGIDYHTNEAGYNSGAVTLGPDDIFVLGDNRPNSSDSHSWGTLPRDLIIGRVVLSYWPPDEWGLIKHGPPDAG
ncbi:MAG: signal peptidase I [Anaerolineae bacterium]|nr:signal peptidase I [Anaerolineae bacterium]